ncbi:MAG: cupredoxin domain-containing protein [Nitrososphaera sp.]
MTDWDLLTPGIGLTSIGIVGVGISLAGVAKTFIDGMHAVSLLTMFIGMIFLASGLFKDGFPSSGRAKSATFITLGFLVTFGVAAAVTVSAQVPSIYAYIGIMLIISIPATVLAVASFKRVTYLKALAIIFISGSVVGGTTFYAFGLVAPKPPVEEPEEEAPEEEVPAGAVVNARILAGASAQNNPDYEPDPLSVTKGDSVSWLNEDNVPHTVTSRQEGLFDSSIIAANATWLLNTAKLDEGSYEYFCTLHPFMVGMLNVGAGQAGQTVPPAAANNTSPTGGDLGVNQTAPSGSAGATVTSVSIVVGSSVPTNSEFFVPDTVQSTVGSLVRWENEDAVPHTVTSGAVESDAPKPDGTFDSGILNKGQTFSYVFDKAGEYDYFCLLHPFMTGKVIVK